MMICRDECQTEGFQVRDETQKHDLIHPCHNGRTDVLVCYQRAPIYLKSQVQAGQINFVPEFTY